MRLIRYECRNTYTDKTLIKGDIVKVRGKFMKILFGFIILKRGKVNIELCLGSIRSTQLINMCSFDEACDYLITNACVKYFNGYEVSIKNRSKVRSYRTTIPSYNNNSIIGNNNKNCIIK